MQENRHDAVIRHLDYHLRHIDVMRCGFGRDEYAPDVDLEHPMAYALYARGLASLHRATGSPWYLETACALRDRLLEIGAEGAWGLPFAWRDKPAGHPYAITTALVAWALLDLAATDPDDAVTSSALRETCDWLTHELPWVDQEIGAAPHFAPGFPVAARNVAAMVGGVLCRASVALGDEQLAARGGAAIEFVVASQHPLGFWTYGGDDPVATSGFPMSSVVDTLHTAYTLDGLLLSEAAEEGVVLMGRRFLDTFLAAPSGRLVEKVVLASPSDDKTSPLLWRPALSRAYVDRARWIVRLPQAARSWAYGAVLHHLSRAALAGYPTLDRAQTVFDHLYWTALTSPDGRFPYRRDDGRRFVRHEAHVFDGVAAFAEAMQSGGMGPPRAIGTLAVDLLGRTRRAPAAV